MELPDLPVRAVLPELIETLSGWGAAVLVAPPGTGKTTLVPLALEGRVVIAEPRRIAARAAASRMAALLGEPVGATVGYSVRGDRKVSRSTRIEVVTSGLLVRRLQHDPELSGVGTVVLDECHERHLDADLLLALLLDARAGLRPDLRLLATSATVAADRLAELMGGVPVLTAHARTYPVELFHVPPQKNERSEAVVARAIRRAVAETPGDVLVFLPGVPEIRRVAALFQGGDLRVDVLHGRLTAAEQDAVLRVGREQRVLLSTSIAESSLTVPGVRAVVDAGLSRVPRVDHRRGLAGLATVRVSAAVADQRAGRAGREAPGRAYRCWPEHEQSTLPRYPEPEIRSADLTSLALELACWGTPDGEGLSWWDAPPRGALEAAKAVLGNLGALRDGRVTERGERMSALGLHPRLARALLDGGELAGSRTATEVVAILDEDRGSGEDITGRSADRREVGRLSKLIPAASGSGDQALVVALAHPERLARRRAPGSPVYLMAGGTAAELPQGSRLADAEWLAIAVADREPGRIHARIRLAARADEQLAVQAAPALLGEREEIAWDGDVVARRVRHLGAIPLSTTQLTGTAHLQQALRAGLAAEGLGLLSWGPAAVRTRQRLAFLHEVLGDPWPEVTDAALLPLVDLGNARRKSDLAKLKADHVLQAAMPWPAAAKFDALAPDRLEVPSGSRIAIDYSTTPPTLPVKVQEVFGWTETPTVAGIPLVLHLLTPAGRPTAVTGDLKSFWQTGYPQVRAELRGRYPKHRWPEDPMTAPPARR
ncbi:ATP-dependent helicase HrpB [Actinosynnema pretiosum subsp. pretiosum]|uniref:ATP-dependent helicase HrpB n=2 Tax=Actinosynnema TaxID=40566 RepID=C6WNJ1_ACTMD|nr:ATP-dependent helicase HrpB [Actinosynnema mirum]ACU34910.1 ATP-dependent helicase HrpB [Actinosynnema mirum DSM 43827]AXX28269.1 ATP-dependent helicase HrpB [Actinosynnema pretiosum subsp. pretiosum]QUF07362.1 ATP-dependent helicase HrpB [Actinosynnema pretiosum subsp. pretiosum]